ncbi:MAG: glycosyltransferase family 2 protein [Granulosicoccus sp.]|nr:glycosyltransferase family 2 protein [Granulosicoccus sp.]
MAVKFSIVIPTYNRSSSVLDTLQSVFDQTLDDFEIVVVDDGSTDDTAQVLSAIDDPRLVVVHQDNAGPAVARNHGMTVACGRYIAFLDSDDRWYPEFLESASETLEKHGQVLLYGQIIVDRGVNRYWVKPSRPLDDGESIYDYLYVAGGFIQTSTIVIPRSLAERVRWDESVTFGDNDQFAIDCWRTGIAFQMLPRPLTLYADIISDDALSQLPIHAGCSEKYTNFFKWMLTQKQFMSAKAWAGFRARFESTGIARSAPLRSFKLLWQGYRADAISPLGIIRQSIQNLFPLAYRRLVDRYVRVRGLSLEQARRQ